jgi:adiponectin receptor
MNISLHFAYNVDMLGFVLFFLLMILTFTAILDNLASVGILEDILCSTYWQDVFIFFIFLIVAQMQMLFSALFHMFGCLSPTMYTWLAKLDYSGITVMIVGSYYPPLYYGLACYKTWRIFYLVCISTLGVIGLIVSFFKVFSTPKYRIVRTGTTCMMAMLTVT